MHPAGRAARLPCRVGLGRMRSQQLCPRHSPRERLLGGPPTRQEVKAGTWGPAPAQTSSPRSRDVGVPAPPCCGHSPRLGLSCLSRTPALLCASFGSWGHCPSSTFNPVAGYRSPWGTRTGFSTAIAWGGRPSWRSHPCPLLLPPCKEKAAGRLLTCLPLSPGPSPWQGCLLAGLPGPQSRGSPAGCAPPSSPWLQPRVSPQGTQVNGLRRRIIFLLGTFGCQQLHTTPCSQLFPLTGNPKPRRLHPSPLGTSPHPHPHPHWLPHAQTLIQTKLKGH